MKKIIVLIFVSILCLNVMSVGAKEVIVEEKIILFKEEMVDENVLKNRINKGITDHKEFKVTSEDIVNELSEDGVCYDAKVKSMGSTVQKIKEVKKGDVINATYVAYVLAEVEYSNISDKNKKKNDPIVTTNAIGSWEDYVWDGTGFNCQFWLRIEFTSQYTERSPSYYNLYKFTKISGKFSNLATGINPLEIKFTEKSFGDKFSDAYGRVFVSRGSYLYSSTRTSGLLSYTAIDKYEGLYTNCTNGDVTWIEASVRGRVSRGGTNWYTPTITYKENGQ